MKSLKIGYLENTYPYKRNIIDIIENVNYLQVDDFYKFTYKLINLVNKLTKNKIKYIRELLEYQNAVNIMFKFYDFNLNKVDLIHLFNSVSFGNTPWIVTYETLIPRCGISLNCHHGENPDLSKLKNNKWICKVIKILSERPCKKIIALSKCSYLIQKELLQLFPEYRDKIEDKLCILHPPQHVHVNNYFEKKISVEHTLSFIFVGRLFFRKGGMEVINSFEYLRSKYKLNIKLIIVSSLDIDIYATKENVEKVKQIINKNIDWIEYHNDLPNTKVIELMKKSHIGLLPTWADTYGFSVLEFQSMGCPVITTDVRALPEINNNDIGWIINIPKNRFGEAIYTTNRDKKIIKEKIENGLENIVLKIFNDRNLIVDKSNKVINSIKENHYYKKYADSLLSIYNEVM